MTVYIHQRLVCDLCEGEVRAAEQKVPGGTVPYVIQRDYNLSHQGHLLDICHDCMPHLMRAFSALKLAKESET